VSYHFTFTATPRPKGGATGEATIDFKVMKLDIALPANAAPDAKANKHALESEFVGIVAHVDTSAHGEISDPRYEVDATSDAIDMMSRAVETLVIPLPIEPVGIGAKWAKTILRRDPDGTDISGSVTMTLLARDTQTATIKVEATNLGKLPIADSRVPKGSFLQRSASSNSQTVVRFDGVAARSDGESRLDITQKVPGEPDQTLNLRIVTSITSK
jgi:hypothetical protein